VSARGERVGRFRGAIGLSGLLVVLAAACGGTVDPEAEADPTLRVGACFVVDAAGRAAPSSCDVPNDGAVTAEVEDAQMCELLQPGPASAFAVVGGRTFCLRDARP
jgi:hypothetical protein